MSKKINKPGDKLLQDQNVSDLTEAELREEHRRMIKEFKSNPDEFTMRDKNRLMGITCALRDLKEFKKNIYGT